MQIGSFVKWLRFYHRVLRFWIVQRIAACLLFITRINPYGVGSRQYLQSWIWKPDTFCDNFCDILGQPMCLLLASGAIKYGQKKCKIFWLCRIKTDNYVHDCGFRWQISPLLQMKYTPFLNVAGHTLCWGGSKSLIIDWKMALLLFLWWQNKKGLPMPEQKNDQF